MKLRVLGALALAALVNSFGAVALAVPTPVSVDCTTLRAIQKYNLDEATDDQVFALVNGVAGGAEFTARLPEAAKTWAAAPKKLAVSDKAPVSLWKGTLNDGEFAVVTVSVFQGAGKDEAALKTFQDSIIAAEKKAPELAKKTITADEFKALTVDASGPDIKPGSLVKNEREVISKIKTSFSRDKNTDHYSGLFNIVVWNDGAAIRKRLVPVGLTFGEHYGNDVKVYTKLKFTRNNVFLKDEKGEWSTDQLSPLSDDEKTIHVKMLENELVKGPDGNPLRKTTDYLADVTVTVGGEAVKWKLEGEVTGVDDIHRYWEFAD